MSRENVEIMREGFRRWVEGGGVPEAIPRELYAEEVEWDLSAYPLVDIPTRGRGRDDLFEAFHSYYRGWRDYRPEVRDVIDAGDDVIVVLHETAKIAGSEVDLERDVMQVWTLREGLVVKWRVFETLDDALAAVGRPE
jgi:ketosteroid isomerase-like protein